MRENYRGMAASNCIAKLFLTIIHNRLSKFAASHDIIPPNQIGYRKGSRTTYHILALKNMIDKYINAGTRKDLLACFVDFKAAFDSVWREGLFYKMLHMSIGGNLLNLLRNMYDKVMYSMKIDGKISKSFLSRVGFKQGCMLKGSNMIVCVLLVSNSWGCCLAAPGNHEGAARVIAPRRDNTRGSLTPTIHIQSCLIPIVTWCQHFFLSNQYSAHEKQLKVWIKSSRSLSCHVTTLSGSKYRSRLHPWSRKCACQFFCGRLGVWNRTAPDRRHLLPVATMKLIMRCVYKLNFKCTLSFPMKMTSSTQLWYIRASAGWCVLRWDRLLGEGLAFVQAGVPSCPRWRDAPLVHAQISNVTSQIVYK